MEKYNEAIGLLNEIYITNFRKDYNSVDSEKFRKAFNILYDSGVKLKRVSELMEQL